MVNIHESVDISPERSSVQEIDIYCRTKPIRIQSLKILKTFLTQMSFLAKLFCVLKVLKYDISSHFHYFFIRLKYPCGRAV